ncbi:MAG TPA: formyltransferase [Steroidobacteraceae bacterium]|nr:formyltransferase [Steroidobacteraceae bacterium]
MFSAIPFAYSEVGFRCLRVLLDRGVEVPLVFTHQDAPNERLWFGNVAQLATERGIEVVSPLDPNRPEWIERVAALEPDYLFSFYYRSLLDPALLGTARRGALNMHGSLLPKYRGRAPVNWAILNGERTTGATLHFMVDKPDAGPIVAQQAVAIGIDDTALDVSMAVAQAAAELLERSLPMLAAGVPAAQPMDIAAGSYFGGRKPEDGRIDWSWPASRIHNLIRAVAPPFPGAFADRGTQRIVFESSRWTGGSAAVHAAAAPCLYVEKKRHLYLDCADGIRLEIPSLTINGTWLDAREFARRYGHGALSLTHSPGLEVSAHEKAAHTRR